MVKEEKIKLNIHTRLFVKVPIGKYTDMFGMERMKYEKREIDSELELGSIKEPKNKLIKEFIYEIQPSKWFR